MVTKTLVIVNRVRIIVVRERVKIRINTRPRVRAEIWEKIKIANVT